MQPHQDQRYTPVPPSPAQQPETPPGYQVPAAPPAEQPAHDPYGFFLNPQQPAKKTLLPSNNGLLAKVLIVGGILLVLVIAFTVFSVLLSSGKNKSADLVIVAYDQQELIRLSTGVSTKLTDEKLQNFAVTTQSSLTSAQAGLLAYLAKNGNNLSAKSLAATANVKTDQALAAAEAASTYDSTYTTVMKSQLSKYQIDIKQAFAAIKSSTAKQLLSKDYNGADLLISQLQ